ncbi:hypothetical protein FHS43_006261 [Streptosporangium becharense]|uniref:Uncharacterized protein n=1 Tax=Streptosporangium becharense TaxID=1816182 RepID=A0A7W9MGU7_9ACTN|nr:hypothetical protein [Streptosporangium becharense]MBB2914949.1 hypothetical protein [Streptosporangium becharense]MBB5820240.1 hypothetical protein [Streptosporangium becharense]
MGLAISVGIETFAIDEEGYAYRRAEMDRLSAVLAKEGVTWRQPDDPVWRGPEGTPPFMRSHVGSFPYGYLRYLHRVVALVRSGGAVTPVSSQEELARDNDLVVEEAILLSSHLLCHSDYDGYFVPVDFDDPIFLFDEAGGGGARGGGAEVIGSSHGLLAELRRCAPAIGIRLEEDGSLSDAEAARVFELPQSAPFEIESVVWLTLHEACRASIATDCAIIFH